MLGFAFGFFHFYNPPPLTTTHTHTTRTRVTGCYSVNAEVFFTVSCTSTSEARANTTAAVSTVSYDGLRLGLTLGATTVVQGNPIELSASEYNTLPVETNVSSANDWVLPGLIMSPCGPTDSPVAYAVIPGHYSAANISAAPAVPYGGSCTTVTSAATLYSFMPSSDVASVYGGCAAGPCSTGPVGWTRALTGYWDSTSGQLSSLTPGGYTAVAEDEWGNMVLATFTVVA